MKTMDLYLYRLSDFNFVENEEYPLGYKHAKIIETKLTNVLPMAYGYYYIGANAIDIYPYLFMTIPSKARTIFCGEEIESADSHSIVIPYQNKQMAKEIFSRWLKAQGFEKASLAVSENPVGHLKRMAWPPSKEEILYAKKWDKIKTAELADRYYGTPAR